MASVQLRNVTKAWGDVVVSKDINLEIQDGEFVVFVGPSGCGKSTLLRMIAGLETVTSGDLFIGDTRMNDVPPAERGIGMVFQSYALYPHLSVAENMSFGLKLAGAKKEVINQRVTQVAEVLQLAHLLERKPKALSGGQRQRVAIGRTLVAEPSVFLLDEPLSNLDAALRVQMRIEISRLHKRLARTMIYVTHDQVEAMTLADKIVVLDAGRVAQVGKPLELYHYPADRFVAGFIGSPKMNFLPVKVTATAIDQVQVELPNRQQVWLPVDSANVQVGANMSLGIRPEHLLPSDIANMSLGIRPEHLLPSDIADVTLEGEVQVVEQLGHETQIHIQIPAIRQNLVYRQNDVVLVEEGATFAIGLPPERCHLFREDGTACRRLHKEPGV
ncbi:maltose/maltodextrin ABC transporter ATP-binding protein MalK [Klebsiella variicola]|uniref:maltose/maltodextrin ABC transporter ATP-binding protein MalK n=5 Tax=Klebsiella pneumoniae complex TaxID=3390273 RepID=UPI0018871758|nr:maltose/maltodextrin ABC transporter ATP-binding protein MalK [Klebsiella variicola]